jgi:hypothetical protein
MNQLVNSALLAYHQKGGEAKLKRPSPKSSLGGSYDTMSELERQALHQMLSEFSGMQAVAIDGEEPDGTHYEYDRNLRTTVRVTSDGERTPVQELERSFGPAN